MVGRLCVVVAVWAISNSMILAEETRTFPEAKCSYTLPDKEWKWTETPTPKKGEMICLGSARKASGLIVMILHEPIPPNQVPTKANFKEFEEEVVNRPGVKKVASGPVRFLEVPSYQVEARILDTSFIVMRVFCANDQFYQIGIINPLGTRLTDTAMERIFEGFRYTSGPVVPSTINDENFESARKRGEEFANLSMCFCCAGPVLVIGAIVGGIVYARRQSRRYDDDEDEDRY